MRIEYVAPATCPDEARVLEEIRARTPHLRLAAEGEPARSLRVRIDAAAASFHGSLTITEPGGSSMRRELDGPTCDAVVSALALVSALTVDPLALANPAPIDLAAATAQPIAAPFTPAAPVAPPPPTPDPTPMPAPLSPAAVAPTVPSATPVRGTRPLGGEDTNPVRAVHPSSATSAPAPTHTPWRVGLGIAGEIIGLAAPDVVYAPVGAVELLYDAPHLFAPSLRLGFLRAEGGDDAGAVSVNGRFARYTWTLGRAEVCPLRVRVARSLALRPCAVIDAGALSTTVTGAPQPNNPERAWVDASLEGRLEWWVLSRVSLELEGGLMAPIVRNTFEFEPNGSLGYRAPAVTGVGSLGVMLSFL